LECLPVVEPPRVFIPGGTFKPGLKGDLVSDLPVVCLGCQEEREPLLLQGDEKTINVVMSDLKKAGYVQVSIDSNDKRKRLYKIISPSHMVNNLEEIRVHKK